MKRMRTPIVAVALSALVTGGLLPFTAASAPAAGGTVVSSCTEAALRAAVAGGGTITFSCAGTITVTAPLAIPSGTTIDGGDTVAISGNKQSQIATVAGGTVVVENISLIDGLVTPTSGGDGTDGGDGTAGTGGIAGAMGVRPSFPGTNGTAGTAGTAGTDGTAGKAGQAAQGGALAIGKGSDVTLTNVSFAGNQAVGGNGGNGGQGGNGGFGGGGGGGGGDGEGGYFGMDDFYNAGPGSVGSFSSSGGSITGTTPSKGGAFGPGTLIPEPGSIDDGAAGGNGGNGGAGGAGGSGGAGGTGGAAAGGAIYNAGTLTIIGSTFSNDEALGGYGGTGGQGGAGGEGGEGGSAGRSGQSNYLQLNPDSADPNKGGDAGTAGTAGAGGVGGSGGTATGGAIDNVGTLHVTGSTFTGNRAEAGIGSMGGAGGVPGQAVGGVPGGTDGGGSQVTGTTGATAAPAAPGTAGRGGAGALGVGGAIANGSTADIESSTFSGDQALGGIGGPGGGPAKGLGGETGIDAPSFIYQGTSDTGWTVSDVPGFAANGSPGGAGADGSDGGTGGNGAGGFGGGIDTTTGASTTIAGLSFSGEKAGGGDGGDGGDGSDGGNGANGGKGGSVQDFYDISPGDGGRGGDGGKGGDGGDGGNGGAALGGAIYGDAHLLGPKPDFEDSDLTGGQEGSGSETAGKGGSAGKGGDGGTFAFSGNPSFEDKYKDGTPPANGVQGPPGTTGSNGVPGDDGIQGSEGNDKDVYGVLTQTPVAVTVTLAKLTTVSYGTAVTADVSVTTTSSVGAPPSGDHVLITATQGSATTATCTVTLPGTSTDYAGCSLPATLAVGTYTVTATLQGSTSTGGDAGYATTSSTPVGLTVLTEPTSTSLPSLSPVTLGSPAPVAVAVSSNGSATPGGEPVTVTATQGGVTKATCTATLGGSPATGTCDLPSTLALGSYTVTAAYAGDGNFGGSATTGTLTITDSTTVRPSVPSPTATSGASVTYSASVAAVSGTPTGTVSFAASNGTSDVVLCATSALTGGTATCPSAAAPLGLDTITATFVGSNGLAPSRGTTTLAVELAPPVAPTGTTASAGATGVDPNGKETAAVPGFTATGLGLGALTVASYPTNPTGATLSSGTGEFFDVKAATGSQLAAITMVDCTLGAGGNFLSWYDGHQWQPFSEETPDTPSAGCITAVVNTTTAPTLQQLTGTVVGASDKPTGDFALTLDPGTQLLNQNSSVLYQVTVSTPSGFTDPVTLTAAGLPAGVTAFFLGSGTTTTTVSPGTTTQLYLSTGQSFTPGTYPFTVTGAGAGLTHVADATVKLGIGLVPKCYAEISGTVTDASTGKPLAGVSVTSGGPQQLTDQNGHYDTGMTVQLGQNLATQQTQLTLADPGYYGVTTDPYIGCGQVTTQNVTLVAAQLGSVTGHVYVGVPDPSDPTSYAKVIATTTPITQSVAVDLDKDGAGPKSTVPDSAGRYELDGVSLASPDNSPETHLLQLVTKTGAYWVAGPQSVQVSAGPPAVQDLVAVPVCTGTITVHAVSSDTGAVEVGAQVQTDDATGQTDRTTTDAHGNATLTVALGPLNNPSGYSVGGRSADGTGSSPAVSTYLSGCGATTSVQLGLHVPVANDGNLTTTVLDAATRQPIPGAFVSDLCVTAAGGQTDAQGVATVSNLEIGQDAVTSGGCSTTVSATGYYNGYASPVLFAGQTTTETVLLTRRLPGVVSGTVTDADTGKPIPNAEVSVGYLQTTTDANGHYAVSDNALLSPTVPNGPNSVGVSATTSDGSYLQSATKTVTVTAGTPVVVNLALTPQCGPATITGGVFDATNEHPIPNAEVIDSVGGGLAHTDTNGAFSLQVKVYGNTPFSDQLEAAAAGYFPAYDTVTLFCGAHVVADFGRTSTTAGAVTGTVTDKATGHPVAGAFVGSSWGATTTTADNGTYSFATVPLGNGNAAESWTVTIDPPTGSPLAPTVVPVTVPAAPPTTTLDIALGSTPPPAVTAKDQTYSTASKTTTLTVPAPGLLAGDTGTDLVVTGAEPTNNGGSVTTSPDGSFTFTPNPYDDEGNTGTFTYTVTDAYGTSATGTATVDIGPVTTPPAPVATDDTGSAAFETPLVVADPGVLGNDTGTGLTVTGHTSPSHGTVSVATTGGYTYTPATGFHGSDSFGYTVTDATGRTASATVSITVAAPPAPTAADYHASTAYQTPLVVGAADGVLSDSSGTRITVTGHTGPAHGTLTIAADGGYTYTPATGFSGADTFGYTITDAIGATATGTVDIAVAAAGLPPAPVASPDSYETAYGTTLTVPAPGVLANDSGTAPVTVAGHTEPGHGTLEIAADGGFSYVPATGFAGRDSFTYTVGDATDRTSASATVTITVDAATPPPPPPAPEVTGVSPAHGPATGGALITVTGSHFTGATALLFGQSVFRQPAFAHAASRRPAAAVGTAPAAAFTVVSDTEITVLDPPGTGTVDIRVTTPGGESAVVPADRFSYDAATTPPPVTTTTTPPVTTTTPPVTTTSGAPSTTTARPTVTTAPPATASGSVPPVATGTPSGSTLPYTGFDVVAVTVFGLLLLAGGALLRRKGARPRHR